MKSSRAKEVCGARVSHLRQVPQSVATALPTIRDIFGVATDAGLAIVDSGATETAGSPEALQTVLSAVQKVMPRSKVEIDLEAGRAMTFKLADGTTFAYSRPLSSSLLVCWQLVLQAGLSLPPLC